MPAHLFNELIALVAPPVCAACRRPARDAVDPLCAACRRALPWLRGSRCPRCGLAAHAGGACPASAAAFDRAWAPLAHEGPARALVGGLKFRGALVGADAMAAQIVAGAPPGLLEGGGVVAVPTHPARRRRRGFDQAVLLADHVARRAGLERSACLRRRGRVTRQLGAARAQRREAGRIVFELVAAPPAHVVLVDDVHTTGATLDGAAHALRAGGAQRIVAVTYTRAL